MGDETGDPPLNPDTIVTRPKPTGSEFLTENSHLDQLKKSE